MRERERRRWDFSPEWVRQSSRKKDSCLRLGKTKQEEKGTTEDMRCLDGIADSMGMSLKVNSGSW